MKLRYVELPPERIFNWLDPFNVTAKWACKAITGDWWSPENVEIRIVAPPERRYSVWIGGSILSSLKTFQRLWVSRKEYQEQGPGVIKRAI